MPVQIAKHHAIEPQAQTINPCGLTGCLVTATIGLARTPNGAGLLVVVLRLAHGLSEAGLPFHRRLAESLGAALEFLAYDTSY